MSKIHTLIITGGSIDTDFALGFLQRKYDHMIAVDGGVRFCYEHKVLPTRIVGDFDTLEPAILEWYRDRTDIEIRRFRPEKDATDTQIAVDLALELKSEQITILGGTGSRLDHVLGNIQCLYLAFREGADCKLLDSHNLVRLIGSGTYVLRRDAQYGKYISLIPYTTDVGAVTLRGMKYPLEKHPFTVLGSGSLGISNEITETEAEIIVEDGIMILIESKD